MSELQMVMERFRNALNAVKDRIETAEARPSQETLLELKASREADLVQFEKLKAELERLNIGK